MAWCVFRLPVRVVSAVAGVACAASLAAPHAEAQTRCSNTSTGRTPLVDLGLDLYNGLPGGLYPGGSNLRPAGHEAAGLAVAGEVRPLNAQGEVDAAAGHIGFVSVGMSLTNQEFEVFEFLANVDPNRNPRVTTINGAQGGQSAFQWADNGSPVWEALANQVALKGLTSQQVQVAWIKQTVRGTDVGGWENYPPFPATAAVLQTKLKDIVRNLKSRYPNLKIAYLSSRVYGGYAPDTAYPEPIAYEEGFGVKWVIEEQINGDPMLAFTGPDAPAPFLAWGPYLWADGLGSDGVVGGIGGRSDGLEYACSDFSEDGLHPATPGRQKVANQLLQFLNADSTSGLWYRNPNPPPTAGTPYYLDLDGTNDYLDAADANTLSFVNGAADRPLTFEAWIRPDTMSVKQNLVSKWGDGANQEYRFYITSGSLRLDLKDSSANVTISAYTGDQTSLTGGWHHVAATYDGRGGATAASGINFYVDGVAVAATRVNSAAYVAMENWTAPVNIGRESTNFKQFNGGLDEVRLWNVARTPAQLQLHMTSELAGTETGLVAYWRLNEGVGATVADDSSFDHTATMYNNPTWVQGGPMEPPAPDTTTPEISNITPSDLTDTGITISFDTNELTTGWVSYTPSTSCPCTDVFGTGASRNHVIRLNGLAPDTFYIYEAKATDAAGNFQVSPTFSFRTLATPPDATPPAVSITSPVGGAVAGTISVTAAATDNVGIVGVQFRVDGTSLGAEVVAPPYAVQWDTTAVGDGPHTIAAEARDFAGNTSLATLPVTVRNTPATSSPFYVDFDGANDFINVPDSNSLSFTSGTADTPLTFELWFRPDTVSAKQNLVSKWGNGGADQEYRLYTSSGSLRLDLRDANSGAVVSVYTGNQNALAGAWHHLAVSYDGRGGNTAANGITFFIDGAAVAVTRVNAATYVTMRNGAAPINIGRESSSFRQYNGALDDIRLWNVLRTQAEIQANRDAELAGTETGLVAYWKLNEGADVTAADASPLGNAGQLVNGPLWIGGGPLSLP